MPLFDAYVMVDWSGGDRRRAAQSDCIWIAHGAARASAPITESLPSRTEAESVIRSLFGAAVESDNRVLVGFDFAYGYPVRFASVLPEAHGNRLPPWRHVWQYLGEHLRDDLGSKPRRKPTNRSNRLEFASAIDAASSGVSPSPFWCLPTPGSVAGVPQKKPPQPVALGNGRSLAPLRITDRRAKSDTPFRLFGTGSVGSQIITRIRAVCADDGSVQEGSGGAG